MTEINERISKWMDDVGMRTDGELAKQMQKIAEEVVEASIEVGWHQAVVGAECYIDENGIQKEFGDILFSTIVACYMAGFNPETCLEMVCEKNESRVGSGRMVNGSFVKKEDLKGEE